MAHHEVALMSEAAAPTSSRPPRRRGPPRQTTVNNIEQVTPKLLRLTVGGDELEGFGPPKPGAHIKLFFPDAASAWNPKDPDAPRPPSRTYTPLHYDPAARSMQIDFVMHGAGLAAGWAQQARVGDTLYLAGPGGGYEVPQDIRTIVLVADETSMPAASMVIEAVPAACAVQVLCEIPDAAEERGLSPVRAVSPRWMHRGSDQGGTLLERAVANLDPPEDTYWWVACEAGAMRRIRTQLLKDRKVAPSHVHTRGYWRLGETNYPDHDYGDS
jgi:NADPH-dependent ferric siderophore reductase